MDTTNQSMVPSSPNQLGPTMEEYRLDSDTLPQSFGSDDKPSSEPTVERIPLGPGKISQRVYENVSSGGHSRNVYGDIYNTYHVHRQNSSSGPAHPFPGSKNAQDDAATTLKNALAFDRMDARLATISTAHAETCQWLFGREEYISWRDPKALYKHRGFFWIKGKPGAGKSTLMKCAHQYGKGTHKN